MIDFQNNAAVAQRNQLLGTFTYTVETSIALFKPFFSFLVHFLQLPQWTKTGLKTRHWIDALKMKMFV